VPAWLLSVLKDHPKGTSALNQTVHPVVRRDFWALVKIIDRPLRSFVSGQFMVAMITGAAVYLALSLLEMLGWSTIQYKVPLALWAAAFQLIPEIGPYFGALPAVIGGFLRSPQSGLAIIAVYIVLHYLINRLVTSRIEDRLIKIHPGLLLVILVALSQFGFIWVFFAMPVVSILNNLFRYLYGRLSDPPLPAGVLPDQLIPESTNNQEMPPARVSLVYKSRAARRSTEKM